MFIIIIITGLTPDNTFWRCAFSRTSLYPSAHFSLKEEGQNSSLDTPGLSITFCMTSKIRCCCSFFPRMTEYLDHLHQHFKYPCVMKRGCYVPPQVSSKYPCKSSVFTCVHAYVQACVCEMLSRLPATVCRHEGIVTAWTAHNDHVVCCQGTVWTWRNRYWTAHNDHMVCCSFVRQQDTGWTWRNRRWTAHNDHLVCCLATKELSLDGT